jgi:hypothetical protein
MTTDKVEPKMDGEVSEVRFGLLTNILSLSPGQHFTPFHGKIETPVSVFTRKLSFVLLSGVYG